MYNYVQVLCSTCGILTATGNRKKEVINMMHKIFNSNFFILFNKIKLPAYNHYYAFY